MAWFPHPRAVVEAAELSFGANQQASIRSLELYPSFLALLSGRLTPARVVLIEPKLKIRLRYEPDQSFDLDSIEKNIAAALAGLTRDLRTSHIAVIGGSAELAIDAGPPVIFEDVSARAAASPETLEFEMSARSSLWQALAVKGKVSAERLAFKLDIAVQRLKINESLAFFPSYDFGSTPGGNASFELEISGMGLRRGKAALGSIPEPLVIARRSRGGFFEIQQLKGAISYEEGGYELDVEQLDLASPRLSASGKIQSKGDRISASVKARDLDIAEVHRLIVRIGDGNANVENSLRYVSKGTIADLYIQSAGRSLAELASIKNMVLSGKLRNCSVVVPTPGYDLELENVTASVHVAENQLKADSVSVSLGAVRGRSGALRLGLEGRRAPFHFDVEVQAGAPELLGVLHKAARSDAFRAEVRKLRNVDGVLSGRLILGETLDAISVELLISDADVRAEYEQVLFPIAIRDGRLNYGGNVLRIEDLRGSVGNSRFDLVGITFHHDGNRRLDIQSKRTSLDLQEAEAFVRTVPALRRRFQKLKSVRGRAELAAFTLTGPYDDPSQWSFASTGSLDRVELQHDDLPAPLTVISAGFDANRQRVLFSNTDATMSDAKLSAGGKVEYPAEQPVHAEISGHATIGEHVTEQLSRSVQLPQQLRLRAPLEVVAERLTWTAGGDTSFLGQAALPGGALLKVDAVKRSRELVLNDVILDDLERRARVTLHLADDHFHFSFNGELTQDTIDSVFASPPMQAGLLRGDFQVSAVWEDPMTMSATGQVSGSNLFVPFGDEKALVEEFSVAASGDRLQVRSADLLWRDSRLRMSGQVGIGKEVLRLDLDATADRLRLEELNRLFDDARDKSVRSVALPRVEGRIGLKLDSLVAESFTVDALQIDTAFARSSVRAEIKRGVVCGINTTGRLDLGEGDIDFDLRFMVKEGDLEPTTVCLTTQQSDVKGTYSLSARLSGKGSRQNLRSALKGNFQLTARKGEFIRSAGLDATFDYLNDSGDFAVAFPDLNKEAFAYELLAAKGSIDGQRLQTDEILIHAAPLMIAGQGTFDLQEKQMDAKGLVSVVSPARLLIRRIPVIGAILGGSLVGIPIRVKGSFDRPDISYLSPADVGAELVNIPLRLLGMPIDAIKLFIPSRTNGDP